jgi:phage terminase large subunit-like protein
MEHNLTEPAITDADLTGFLLPRIQTPELDLPSRGHEVIELAKQIGVPLLPWQEHVILQASKVRPNGKPAHKSCCTVIARQNGKSHLLRMRILAGLFLWNDKLIIATAQNRDIALETFRLVADTIENNQFLIDQIKHIRKANGQEEIVTKTGNRYKIVAPNSGARGMSADLVVIDEAREFQNTEAYSALVYTTMARPNSQIWLASNAGDAFSTILNRIRQQAYQAIAAPGSDETIGYWEYSAPDGTKLDDPQGWRYANPALGHTIDADGIKARLKDPESVFRTEVLCQWVETLQNPFPEGAWANCLDQNLKLPDGKAQYLAIDVSPDRRHASLVGATRVGDEIVVGLIQTWESDSSVDDLKIAAAVSDWARKFNSQCIGFDKYTASGIAARLSAAGIPVQDLSGSIFYQACDELLSAMSSNRLRHSGQEVLTAHIYACARKSGADGGWRIVRRDSSGYVTAAIALAMVTHFAVKPSQVAGIFAV